MVDIHCHIIPEVDDGAKSWAIAEEMCRIAIEDGVEHIVATPHSNQRYAYDRNYLTQALARLQIRVGKRLRLTLGCDFHLSDQNLNDAVANPKRYTIGDTHYLLVELSNSSVPPWVGKKLTALADHGIFPILTHPERNPVLEETPERVLEWAASGVIIQVTASAFTGLWGEKVRRNAQRLLVHHAVHVVASDAHDSTRRVPGLSSARAALAEIGGKQIAHALVDTNPRAIVNGKSLPYCPPVAGL
ncbi:MAG: exopolysaccharide biosynthesis protein [Acidobacteria bacterium]|nr:exopolysaccharide biosynthesis protein [Acidobacteriota bacterium]